MHSTSFLPTWPQFYIISHALQQFFVKLALIYCNLPRSRGNPTPTRTFFGHTGPHFQQFTSQSTNPTPHSHIFLAYWPIFFHDGIHSAETLPPLRQFLGIMAQIYFQERCVWIRKTIAPTKTIFT